MVLDNNCVISGLTTFGAAREILGYVSRGEVVVAVSDDIQAEYQEVIDRRSFRRLLERTSLSVRRYRERLADVIEVARKFDLVGDPPQCRDPDDRKYLHCAVVARADFLVSRDEDLLSLEAVGLTRIVRPEELLAHLRNPSATP